MGIRRVVPDIHSDRFEANREFYIGFLGFEESMDLGWIVTFTSPSNPSAQISILKEDLQAKINPDLTVEVENIDEVHARAVAQGLEIVYPLHDEEWGVRRFFAKDPNGLIVNVMGHAA